MLVEVYSKDVYGTTKMYPANTVAKAFAELLGQKTLTVSDIAKIRKISPEIEVVLVPNTEIYI
jgi:hypothetical protein